MTAKKALDVIKKEYCGKKQSEHDKHEAYDVVVSSLNKHIKKLVRCAWNSYDGEGNPVVDMAYCPNCEHFFEEDEENWECNFCPECGQKLSWEEVNGR